MNQIWKTLGMLAFVVVGSASLAVWKVLTDPADLDKPIFPERKIFRESHV